MWGGGEQRAAEGGEPELDAPGASAWRKTLLNVLLTTSAALATITFPVISWQAITAAHAEWIAVMAVMYVVLLSAAVLPRAPYVLRSLALLVGLGGVAVLGFLRVGYQLGPGIGSAMSVVLAGLLLGRRALIATFCFTLAAIIGMGILHSQTNARDMAAHINDVTLLSNWVRVALVYALFTGVLAAAVMFVVDHIERTLAESTDALARLRSAKAQHREAEHALDDAQRTIQQMQKMEAVGRLAGGVAHDFNNALVVILGWADLLRTAPPDQDRAQRNAALDEILTAGHRASRLTQQLLSFARKSVLLPEAVSPAQLLTELARMLERVLPANIQLLTQVAPDVPAILADPTQMHQALLNLCLNARDAMPAGGTLEIRAEHAQEHACFPGSPWVVLSVRDTGVGMDEATQQHAFEPFFTTKGELGTGLGLASVYGIVQQTRGHVQLESQLGSGTTVTLFLPPTAAGVPEPDPARVSGRIKRPTTATILVAEDEAPVRNLMVEALRRAGHTVLAAEDGSAALELARRFRGRIDVLCTDGIMPGISSAALIEGFRTLFPEASVLFCSGHIEKSLQEQLTFTQLSYLHKPFTSEALTGCVQQLLEDAEALARRAS